MRDAVRLLLFRDGYVRNRTLRVSLGISRQRASVLLRRMVEGDELKPLTEGRNAKYGAGFGLGSGSVGITRGTRRCSMWDLMAERDPHFAYLGLAAAGKRHFRTRREALELIDSVRRTFIVLDFDGVETVTRGFLDALLGLHSQHDYFVQPINASPPIAREIASVEAAVQRKHKAAPTPLAAELADPPVKPEPE